MTREQAEAKARELNNQWIARLNNQDERIADFTQALLDAEARGRAEERERCAKLCDEEEKSESAWMFKYQSSGDDSLMAQCQGGAMTARELATMIRLPAPTEGEGERG